MWEFIKTIMHVLFVVYIIIGALSALIYVIAIIVNKHDTGEEVSLGEAVKTTIMVFLLWPAMVLFIMGDADE